MATFAQIKEVRLSISDPEGVIDILEASSLPTEPAPQTAYLVSSVYYTTEETGTVVAGDYSIAELKVSDTQIGAWIDAVSVNDSKCKAIGQIMAKLLIELRLVRFSAGADTTEYISLRDVYYGYKDLLAMYTETKKTADGNSTGRYYSTNYTEIAGGDL